MHAADDRLVIRAFRPLNLDDPRGRPSEAVHCRGSSTRHRGMITSGQQLKPQPLVP
jgi:hypothetical protein